MGGRGVVCVCVCVRVRACACMHVCVHVFVGNQLGIVGFDYPTLHC